MFNQKKRCLIVEENDVTSILAVVNRHQGFFGNNDKAIGNLGWANEPTKWYVRFYASDREWGRITEELSKIGKIYLNGNRKGITDLYFMRDGA